MRPVIDHTKTQDLLQSDQGLAALLGPIARPGRGVLAGGAERLRQRVQRLSHKCNAKHLPARPPPGHPSAGSVRFPAARLFPRHGPRRRGPGRDDRIHRPADRPDRVLALQADGRRGDRGGGMTAAHDGRYGSAPLADLSQDTANPCTSAPRRCGPSLSLCTFTLRRWDPFRGDATRSESLGCIPRLCIDGDRRFCEDGRLEISFDGLRE